MLPRLGGVDGRGVVDVGAAAEGVGRGARGLTLGRLGPGAALGTESGVAGMSITEGPSSTTSESWGEADDAVRDAGCDGWPDCRSGVEG